MTDPRMVSALAMLRRAGARKVQIRYQDDEAPTVWIAVAELDTEAEPYCEVAAAFEPLRAVLRLCELLIDGGECQHCHRPSGFEPDRIEEPPGGDVICWYVYDPELQTFRRGCE